MGINHGGTSDGIRQNTLLRHSANQWCSLFKKTCSHKLFTSYWVRRAMVFLHLRTQSFIVNPCFPKYLKAISLSLQPIKNVNCFLYQTFSSTSRDHSNTSELIKFKVHTPEALESFPKMLCRIEDCQGIFGAQLPLSIDTSNQIDPNLLQLLLYLRLLEFTHLENHQGR